MEKLIKFYEEKDKTKIREADDVFNNIRKIDINHDQENLLVFYLDTRHRLIDCEVLFKGGVNECCLDPKVIFRRALLKNAVGIIVAHNHPSGNLTPSMDDIKSLNTLKKGGDFLDISVLDGVIFSENNYISMLNEGVFS